MARSVSFIFAVLLAIFHTGTCLRCYQCVSEQNKDCKDPFGASVNLAVDCNAATSKSFNRNFLNVILSPQMLDGVTGAPQSCVKIVMESGTTVRTCLDNNPTAPGEICKVVTDLAKQRNSVASVASVASQVKFCSSCDKDNCNGAGSITASIPVALGALFISYLYYKQ